MAGVVKGKGAQQAQQAQQVQQQVVSNGCALAAEQCAALDPLDVVDNFAFAANTSNDPTSITSMACENDLSLQDLIDSELALRISSASAADKTDLLLDLSDDAEVGTNSVESVSPLDAQMPGVVNGNLVTDFLDHERSHSEQDGSLSLSLSSNAAPLCSVEMTSELGSDGPADSDFSPNLANGNQDPDDPGDGDLEDLEPDLLADEATLAEDLSMASDRSQERTGSLLDLDPLRPDSPSPGTGGTSGTSGTSPCPEPEPQLPQPTVQDEEQAEQAEQGGTVEEEGRSRSPAGPLGPPAPCSEESGAVLSAAAAAAAAQQQTQTAAASIADSFDVADDATCPASTNAPVAEDANAEDDVLESPVPSVDANPSPSPRASVMDNSMASAVPPTPASTTADPAEFENGFETWSTVEDAVAKSELVVEAEANGQAEAEVEPETQPSIASDTETVSETSERKSVSKKKKTDGSESTKKKTKKSKKSDEKENISVLTNGHVLNGHVENGVAHVDTINGVDSIPHSNGYADCNVVEDDLSNVCVKDLKSAYANLTKAEAAKEIVKDLKNIDHDIIYCGPIKNLKQTYYSETIKESNGNQSPDRKETIATGISIRDLRRSFGDLRNCENGENGEQYPQEEEICNEGKARSLGDLRRLSRDLCRPENNSYSTCSRKPIHTGVSVQALKSSFSKFDQLSKKTVLHVRSVDASKVQKQFNEAASTSPEAHTNCKACGKQVFVMEQIKAEKSVWHKNCFRCKECSKQLTVDTYSSNEGDIFCKPHFRELFKPKAVVEDSPEPTSDKPDLGLEELSSLNVKSRYQVFEKSDESKCLDVEKSPSSVNVKRSPSILSKLAKFQAKGMDIGVTDESLNGIPYEESSTSSEEEEEDGEGDEENGDIIKSRRAVRERPMSFSKMEDVKSRWETGSATKKEERREERKQEIQSIRSRLFMGKQGKMKEMYEQAVKESEQPAARRGAEVRSEKAKSIKEKFERGETLVSDEEAEDDKKIKDEDLGVFEAGISKKSRSLFLELDASAAKTAQQMTSRPSAVKDGAKKREVQANHQTSSEVVKASDKVEDVQVETADVTSKFKFFETYKAPEKQRKAFRITPPREGQVKTESPDREVYRDPDVVRADDPIEGDELQHSMTTSKMLSIFRQMEEKAQREDVPDGPKPLKCFTPPPDYKAESSSEDDRSDDDEEEDDEDDEEDEEEDDGVVRSSMKAEAEILKAAKEAAKAKTLRAKFEHWEEQENNINTGGGNINPALLESEHESIESTKSLRARFESLRKEADSPKEKPRPKVNRFVEIQTSCAEFCDSCEKKVYPLEKVETGGKLFHKGCFRCMQCSCILRMESYTLNNGKLYCIPHFKQLFISKGNYDEGFGLDQHKRKWNSSLRENGDILLSGIDANGNNH